MWAKSNTLRSVRLLSVLSSLHCTNRTWLQDRHWLWHQGRVSGMIITLCTLGCVATQGAFSPPKGLPWGACPCSMPNVPGCLEPFDGYKKSRKKGHRMGKILAQDIFKFPYIPKQDELRLLPDLTLATMFSLFPALHTSTQSCTSAICSSNLSSLRSESHNSPCRWHVSSHDSEGPPDSGLGG